jgi:phage terminase large subunit
MELTFNAFGNDRQIDAVRAWIDPTVTDIVYGGSKGSGKSYLGVSLIFGDALMYPETHYFIARKKLNDLRKFTIPSIHEVFGNWGIDDRYYNFNGSDNYYRLYNGSVVYLLQAKFEPSDPFYYRFGSMQMTRGMIEEAGEFEVEAKNNLAASIGRWKNDKYGLTAKLLQTCNPAKNYLYKDYYKPHKAGQLEAHKRFIQALPTDNKKLDSGYLENLRRNLSHNMRERLLLGNWEYDDDPTALCDYDSITGIFSNDHLPTGKKYLTADIARMGSDKAIILVWDDMRVIECHIFEVSRMTELQNCINAMRSKHQIPTRNCIADEDGIGGGVVDNTKILGFVNGSKAMGEENYANLQAQCCYKLAEAINAGGVHIECDLSEAHKEEIIEDLEQLKTYDEDKDGKLKILPKEKVKENIGRSPDWRDVLMMRMYFNLKGTFTGSYSFA